MSEENTKLEVLTEQRGDILLITLNRPSAMNSMTRGMLQALMTALVELEENPDLKVGVITGAGSAFCSGLDLKVYLEKGLPGEVFELFPNGAQKPLIAAVESFALAGGLEIALMCDLIVTSEGAKFGVPEVQVGLFAAAGGVIRLPSRVGFAVAMEMALTGEPITAEQALAAGMVNHVVSKGATLEKALKLAQRIARNAPMGVSASRRMVRSAVGMEESEAWKFQQPLIDKVLASDDAQEGPRAFTEKRAPNWSGH